MFHWIFATRVEKSPTWYLLAIMVTLVIVIYGLVIQMYVMSIAAFLFVGVYMFIENNSAPEVSVDINEEWIQVANTFYEFSKIAQFSILSHSNTPIFLRLHLKKDVFSQIDLRLTQEVNVVELREFLLSFIEENPDEELSGSDYLTGIMRL